MHWTESEDYQHLLKEYAELEDAAHRQAFEAFVERMWACPSDYKGFLQAYLEFKTPDKPKMPRLQAMMQRAEQKSQSKRKRRRRRRPRRRRKKRRK